MHSAPIGTRASVAPLMAIVAALAMIPLAAAGQQPAKPASAPIAQQAADAPQILRMKFKAGDVSKYQTNMQMKMVVLKPTASPADPSDSITIPMEMKMLSQQKVLKLNSDGGADVSTAILTQETTVNGQPGPHTDIPVMTTSFDTLGKVLKMTGLPTDNPASSMLNGMFGGSGPSGLPSVLPENAVRPGDSWDAPMTIPNFGAGTMHFTLVKYEVVAGHNTALIHGAITLPVKLGVDSNGKLTATPEGAIMTMEGAMTSSMDTDIAMLEGKIIHSKMNVHAELTINTSKLSEQSAGAPTAGKMTESMTMTQDIVPNSSPTPAVKPKR